MSLSVGFPFYAFQEKVLRTQRKSQEILPRTGSKYLPLQMEIAQALALRRLVAIHGAWGWRNGSRETSLASDLLRNQQAQLSLVRESRPHSTTWTRGGCCPLLQLLPGTPGGVQWKHPVLVWNRAFPFLKVHEITRTWNSPLALQYTCLLVPGGCYFLLTGSGVVGGVGWRHLHMPGICLSY